MKQTTNYKLNMPEVNESVDINILNTNMETLDGVIKPIDDNIKGLLNVNKSIATKSEAESGSVNNKYMTPLRTKEAITKLSPKVEIVDNLTDGGRDKALSAEQGKVLFQSGIERNQELVANLNSKGVTATTNDNLKRNIEKVKDIKVPEFSPQVLSEVNVTDSGISAPITANSRYSYHLINGVITQIDNTSMNNIQTVSVTGYTNITCSDEYVVLTDGNKSLMLRDPVTLDKIREITYDDWNIIGISDMTIRENRLYCCGLRGQGVLSLPGFGIYTTVAGRYRYIDTFINNDGKVMVATSIEDTANIVVSNGTNLQLVYNIPLPYIATTLHTVDEQNIYVGYISGIRKFKRDSTIATAYIPERIFYISSNSSALYVSNGNYSFRLNLSSLVELTRSNNIHRMLYHIDDVSAFWRISTDKKLQKVNSFLVDYWKYDNKILGEIE